MSESENSMRKILKGLEIPILEVKDLKFKKVRILDTQSIKDDGYENLK